MPNVYIDPTKITCGQLPLIVFSDHTSGLIEWLIKWRTKGAYNHIMWMHREGFFASQGNTYSEATLARYMKKGNRLKFVRVIGLTPVQRSLIFASISQKLKLPWWRKLYDWTGVLGQAIGWPNLNVPGLDFCSEDVPRPLFGLLKYLDITDVRYVDIQNIPRHTSPQALNEYMQAHPKTFECVGKWESDDE